MTSKEALHELIDQLSDAEAAALLERLEAPERERLAWEDSRVYASLRRALEQAEIGELHDLGDFTKYAEPA